MDSEFEQLLARYLDPAEHYSPNRRMADVEIVWVRDRDEYGAKHIREKHCVTEQEVEEVLFEVPPEVEAMRHKGRPKRTIFFGETRLKRCLFISCEDSMCAGIRTLTPITAFSPEEGWAYWESLKKASAEKKGEKSG